ncbi:hypothetical protein OEA41_009839 [Lepraria neglecta]|uniref:Killer toxin Kp4 domain-containing protein n=1 Tax=Lepraria neglecta TaxID=209136 RepID=A0AAD9YVF5_9LECA|nr:hypothetical protein OEA41_009839 [Lepraria neglecta]
MHPPTTIATLLPLTALLPCTTSLGINCRGSGFCALASWNNKSPERITQVLRDAVWASSKPNSTLYPSGSHIICVSESQPITLGISAAGAVQDPPITGTGTGTFSLTGSIAEGGICLFPQGANLTLEQIRPLTDAVVEHGCHTWYVLFGVFSSQWVPVSET